MSTIKSTIEGTVKHADIEGINRALDLAADEIGAWLVAEGKKRAAATMKAARVARRGGRQVNPESRNQRAMALLRAGASDLEVLTRIPDISASHVGLCRRRIRAESLGRKI